MFVRSRLVLLLVVLLLGMAVVSSPNAVLAVNPLPQGLDYPFPNPEDWQIINGYNDGSYHGSVKGNYDYFYAYYAFDLARKSGHGQTEGSVITLPTDAYYFKPQSNTPAKPGQLCVDFSIGTFAEPDPNSNPPFAGRDIYLEVCHVNFFPPFLVDLNTGNVTYQFVAKGTPIGTVANAGDCANCTPPHVHIAVYMAVPGAPWTSCGGSPAGWCRIPYPFEAFANYSFALGGHSYPPLETQLFQRPDQYDTTPLDTSGGGSTEGNQGQTGNSRVDFYENTYNAGTQYGYDVSTNGWVNLPDYLNDKTSSIDIDPGFSVLVAKDQNGGGTHKCLVTSYSDLSGAYYDDASPMTDTISSVNVFQDSTCGGAYLGTVPGDTVSFWVDPAYYNTVWGVHDPYTGNLPNYLQNSMTSIGVTPGWSAVLYDSANLDGGFTCYTSSSPNLVGTITNTGSQVNDSIESVEVFHDSNCGGRLHAPTATFDANVSNLSIKEVTNHLVWSGATPGWQHFDFGDGATFDVQGSSGDVSPTHQYANFGTYEVSVLVTGTDGQGYLYTDTVDVVQPVPTYSLTIDSADTASGLVNFTLDWNNALADWQHIDFGDGQSFDVNGASGHQSASHVYNPSQNPYTLSFTVKGTDNQNYVTSQQVSMPFPTISLTLNSVDAVTGLVNYTAAWANAPTDSWQRVSFGQEDYYVDYQGANGSVTDTHTYPPGTYTMTFAVNCRDGQVYTTTQQIVVAGSPTATPTPPSYSLTIDSVDQSSGLTTFTLVWSNALNDWQHIDFGDGQSFDVQGGSGNQQATHIYNPGTYTLTFTVKGLDGQNYPTSQQVSVSGPPTATPTPVPTPPTLSLTIVSFDNATGVVTFEAVWSNALNDWQHMDFGHDGAYVDYQGGSGDHTDSNIIPVGTYTFTLTVKGLDGQNYTVSQQVTRS